MLQQRKNSNSRKKEIKKELESALEDLIITDIPKSRNEEVFVVYGCDENARNELEAMLRRWGLKPLILDQMLSEGQTIIEKLEKYVKQVKFGIVLAIPDDIGYPKDNEDKKAPRARQNVVLELGMLLAKLGRDKVAILLKDEPKMEKPSDIEGLIYIPFKESISESARLSLAKEMNCKGYTIDIQNL